MSGAGARTRLPGGKKTSPLISQPGRSPFFVPLRDKEYKYWWNIESFVD